MKIQFIGTGSILTSAISASLLIDDCMLIDVPNGLSKHLRRGGINISALDAIFISHFHGDHYFDLPFLLLEIGLQAKRTRPFLIYAPRGAYDTIKNLHSFAFNNWDKIQSNANLSIIEYPGEGFDVACNSTVYNVSALPVQHEGIDAFGFIISNESSTLGYTGDSIYCKAVETIVSMANSIVLDVSFLSSNKSHMGLDAAQRIIAEHPDKKFFSTHMSDEVRNSSQIKGLTRPTDFDIFYL